MTLKTLRCKVTDPKYTPTRANPGDAGLDLKAAENALLFPGDRQAVETGVSVEIPDGYVGLLCARSGNAARRGLGIVNGVGVIDSGYRGPVNVLLINHGRNNLAVMRGDRIAQLLIVPIETPDVEIVDRLSDSDRGTGGLGSSGR
nr:MAG TPA: dUTPase [Caudoviricetes sp.]